MAAVAVAIGLAVVGDHTLRADSDDITAPPASDLVTVPVDIDVTARPYQVVVSDLQIRPEHEAVVAPRPATETLVARQPRSERDWLAVALLTTVVAMVVIIAAGRILWKRLPLYGSAR